MNRFSLTILLAIVFILSSCKKNAVDEPMFDKQSAHRYVKKQVDFGPRVPNTEAHRNCRDWMISEFKANGAELIAQDFTAKAFNGEMLNGTNIIASYNPQSNHRIIIAAHWDSRPFSDQETDSAKLNLPVDGADDGASGTGIILEISRLLQQKPLKKLGVDLILFDCEDYGQDGGAMESWCLGSQHWSQNFHVPAYRADYGILLDMVGAKDPYFSQEYYSRQLAPRVMDKVWGLAHDMGYGHWFVKEAGAPIIDDHIFVNKDARIAMIDIINRPQGSKTGFVRHWHTQQDNMNAIDPNTLEGLGKILIRLIYLEDADKI